MYANFTEETCTGTGATLALAGGTTGNIVFSESFTDGDEVAYVLEDSGGTIKVAGVGLYVSATDDITRNDTWNWNGTVIDDNPTTNITLSGGTHTVRCDVVAEQIPRRLESAVFEFIFSSNTSSRTGESSKALVADTLYYVPFLNLTGAEITVASLAAYVTSAGSGSARLRLAIATAGLDGEPMTTLFQTGEIDTSTTGSKSDSIVGQVPVGWCYAIFLANEAITIKAHSGGACLTNPLIGQSSVNFTREYGTRSFTYAVIPTDLDPMTGSADITSTPVLGLGV